MTSTINGIHIQAEMTEEGHAITIPEYPNISVWCDEAADIIKTAMKAIAEGNHMERSANYTQFSGYRLPNRSTMENLSMRVSAGEGAVLRYDDFVIVTDQTNDGFIAGIYEFSGEEESYVERELHLTEMADRLFRDGGHAVEAAFQMIGMK